MSIELEKSKILIIDDDPSVIQTLQKLLQKRDYQVDVAATGEEGVQKARETVYGLVIADVRMPGMGGIKAVELIREEVLKKGKNS